MALSLLSILKDVLKLNCMHVSSCETETVTVSRNKELFEQQRIIVHASPHKKKQKICPKCGRRCSGYDTKYPKSETTWRAPNINGVPVLIRYTPNRIECPEHGVLTENIPWADGESHYTEAFNNEVAWLAMRMSKSAVTDFVGINWRTVGNCIKAAWERIEPDVSLRLRDLRRICVDETGSRKGYEYITVVYDMDRNRVVWVSEGVGRAVFEKFCMLLPPEERSKIEVVAGDGARWIDTCVKDFFPNATRCVDFFHVVEWANTTLDKVRMSVVSKARREYDRLKEQYRREEAAEAAEQQRIREACIDTLNAALSELSSMPKRGRPSRRKCELRNLISECEQALQATEADVPRMGRPRKEQFSLEHQQLLNEAKDKTKEVKDLKYALIHNPENCSDNQRDKLKLIENSYPDLYRAYQLKESLRLILHFKDQDLAAIELENWIRDAAFSDIKAMKELSEKVKRHSENILNSIRCQANSAKSESANTTIKTLIKVARGFRNMDNLIAFIYLKCSDLVIPLNNRYQPDAEKAAKLRERANELRRKREEAKQAAYDNSRST